MKKKDTIIFGGAFNPPTLAHVQILSKVLEYARTHDADVWLIPSGNRKDKTIPVPRARRLALIDAMRRDAGAREGEVYVYTAELERTVPVETIDTLAELEANYPDRRFIFVCGADSTETMRSWRGGEYLLAELPMLVVARDGSRIHPDARLAEELVIPDLTPTSSTEVRTLLGDGRSVAHLVSPRVHEMLIRK